MDTVKEIMKFVVDNGTLITAFVTAVIGIIVAIHQGIHRIAAQQALDVTAEAIEIKEGGDVPREEHQVKRQIEAAAPVLSRLAVKALNQSVNRANARVNGKEK